MDEKRRARTAGRAARGALGEDARRARSEAIAARALALPEVAGARAVLAYAALPDEADPAPLVLALRARGARVAYPRVEARRALSLRWATEAELPPGYRGILEPAADAPVAQPADIELALVPGTAFDAEGHRLGMGGGFYDRLLPLLPAGAVKAGIAFDEQVVARVPCEPHDAAVDIVLTPTRVLRAPAD